MSHGWVPVDIVHGRTNCATELETLCVKPILYVVACNSDGTIKDLTKKYVNPSTYLTQTRKARIQQVLIFHKYLLKRDILQRLLDCLTVRIVNLRV